MEKRRRGNPQFMRKLPDDDLGALQVALAIDQGETRPAAIGRIAASYGLDDDTGVRKIYDARRAAVEVYLKALGAIRKE